MRKVLIALVACAAASCALGCSTCIAHAFGAAMHGIGAQTLGKGRAVLAISYFDFTKSNAGDMPDTREHERFGQTNLDFEYGATDQLLVRVSVPQVNKTIAKGADSIRANGTGDASIGLMYQLKPTVKQEFLTAFTFDVKLPTGANNRRDLNGDLADQHAQLGSGSADVSFGALVTREGRRLGELWFAGVAQRINGSNSRGYHFGDTLFYNLGVVEPLHRIGAAVIELNGRIAAKDRTEDGSPDGESGGHLMYLSLSWRYGLTTNLGLTVAYQQPVITNLNGSQHESGVFTIGVSHQL